MDSDLLSFWHLSEVEPLSEDCPGLAIPHPESYFVFADWCLWAHAYAVRLSNDPGALAPVMVVYDRVLLEVAPSFRTFLERYVAGDRNVLLPRQEELRAP